MYFGNKSRTLSKRRQEYRSSVTNKDNHVRELVVAFYDVVRGFGIAVEEKDASKSGEEQKKYGLGTFFHATENEGEHVPEPGEKVEGTQAEAGKGRVLLDWRGGSVPLEKAAEKRKELLAARAAPGAQSGAELQRAVDDLTQQVRDLQAKEESNERKLREHATQLLQRKNEITDHKEQTKKTFAEQGERIAAAESTLAACNTAYNGLRDELATVSNRVQHLPTLEDIRKLFSGEAPSADEDVELEDADGEDEDNDFGGEKKRKCVTAGRKSTVTTVKKIAAPEKAGRSQSARGKSSTGERKQLKRNPTGAAPKGLDDTDGDKTPTGNTPKNASKEGKKAGEG